MLLLFDAMRSVENVFEDHKRVKLILMLERAIVIYDLCDLYFNLMDNGIN